MKSVIEPLNVPLGNNKYNVLVFREPAVDDLIPCDEPTAGELEYPSPYEELTPAVDDPIPCDEPTTGEPECPSPYEESTPAEAEPDIYEAEDASPKSPAAHFPSRPECQSNIKKCGEAGIVTSLCIPHPVYPSSGDMITIPRFGLEVFALVATYLYTGDYRNSPSLVEPAKWAEYSDIEKFHKQVQLYSFSRNYELEVLGALAVRNIEASSMPELQSLLEISKETYEDLPEDDVWFAQYFKTAFRRGLDENPKLTEQSWILETIKRGGKLAMDLFATLANSVETAARRPQGLITGFSPQTADLTCANKAEHLSKLGKKGSWATCVSCKRDRSRILSLGSTIISLAFSERDSCLGSSDDIRDQAGPSSNISSDIVVDTKKAKKERKRLRKQMRAAYQQPHIQLLASMLCGEALEGGWAGLCPDQKDHLKKVGEKWLWEDCSACLQSRTRILEKVRQLELPKEVTNSESNEKAMDEIEPDDDRRTTKIKPQPQTRHDHEISRDVSPECNSTQAAASDVEVDKRVLIIRNAAEQPNPGLLFAGDPVDTIAVHDMASVRSTESHQEAITGKELEKAAEDVQSDGAWSDQENWSEFNRDLRIAEDDDAMESILSFDRSK
ncbi:hypothetical protein G7Y89_g1767 [Cudoniella acicularis]|uniref:BTB domain-containing protein n=1 Tax=Cudoniella acicularis TaxID=354080 RepID=A0A8H4RWL8_9HELO|nr:hypothetical protein G7Y89_g1767 [Cudoniella acicularis]